MRLGSRKNEKHAVDRFATSFIILLFFLFSLRRFNSAVDSSMLSMKNNNVTMMKPIMDTSQRWRLAQKGQGNLLKELQECTDQNDYQTVELACSEYGSYFILLFHSQSFSFPTAGSSNIHLFSFHFFSPFWSCFSVWTQTSRLRKRQSKIEDRWGHRSSPWRLAFPRGASRRS